MIISGAKEKNP